MIQTRRELGGAARHLEREADQIRGALPSRARSAEDEQAIARRNKNELLVKGRIVGHRTVWDVFRRTSGGLVVELAGLEFEAEAIARARDLLLGRMSVSFAGVRGAFSAAGRLLIPNRSIDLGGGGVRVQHLDDGSIAVRKG